jgi:hypothetical protein
MEACLERKEPTPEQMEVETTAAPEDWPRDQEGAVAFRSPLKRRSNDNILQGTPKGQMMGKRHR